MNNKNSILRAYAAPEVLVCEIEACHVFATSTVGGGINSLENRSWGDSEDAEY